MVLLHNLQTTGHSTHHTKIILIQKGNKFIIKDKVVSYKGISVFNENLNMFINTQTKWSQTSMKQLRNFFLLPCQKSLNNKIKVQTF